MATTCFTGTGWAPPRTRYDDDCITPSDVGMPALMGLIVGIIMFAFGLRSVWKRRLIQNTPRSKARSVAMGRVEVQGTIAPFQEITVAPFSGVQCVHFSYTLEKQFERRNKEGRMERYWGSIDTARWSVPFFVQDDTGKILVDPKGSEMDTPPDHVAFPILPGEIPDYVVTRLKGRPEGVLRYTETILRPGDTVFVLGYAGDNPHVAETTADTAVADKMIQARAGHPFFVSDKPEKQVTDELLALSQLLLVAGPILSVICLIILIGLAKTL